MDRIVKISEYRQLQIILDPIPTVNHHPLRRTKEHQNQSNIMQIPWPPFTNTSKWKVDFGQKWKISIVPLIKANLTPPNSQESG